MKKIETIETIEKKVNNLLMNNSNIQAYIYKFSHFVKELFSDSYENYQSAGELDSEDIKKIFGEIIKNCIDLKNCLNTCNNILFMSVKITNEFLSHSE